jgi:hypothetical protein
MALLLSSPTIASGDAADLRAYFRFGGLAAFDKSPLAAMLDRASLFRGHCTPCLRCGGDRAGGNLEHQVAGCGLMCTREDRHRLREIGLRPSTDEKCRTCKGTGWVVRATHRHRRGPITARPTGSSIRSSSAAVTLTDGDVTLLGAVSRRLAMAELIWDGATRVLEIYYGSQIIDGGRRLTALWALTPTGKRMLRRNRVKGLDPERFFANERAVDEVQPSARRRLLFAAADKEASELRRSAVQAWNLSRTIRGRL